MPRDYMGRQGSLSIGRADFKPFPAFRFGVVPTRSDAIHLRPALRLPILIPDTRCSARIGHQPFYLFRKGDWYEQSQSHICYSGCLHAAIGAGCMDKGATNRAARRPMRCGGQVSSLRVPRRSAGIDVTQPRSVGPGQPPRAKSRVPARFSWQAASRTSRGTSATFGIAARSAAARPARWCTRAPRSSRDALLLEAARMGSSRQKLSLERAGDVDRRPSRLEGLAGQVDRLRRGTAGVLLPEASPRMRS